MSMQPIRIYANTSIFGGVLDQEFETASQVFFEQVREGRFQLITSPVVQAEIELAPEPIRIFFDEVKAIAEIIELNDKALILRQAYMDAGIVTPKSATDALHVALATLAECTLIVSWNFRHIVHFDKIPLYRAVNTLQGYREISIYSPSEAISYEK